MKHRHTYGAFVIWISLFVLVSSPWAQEPANHSRAGLVQDWTQHHILFSRDGLLKNPGLIYREPRVAQQAMQRWQGARQGFVRGAASTSTLPTHPQRDWSVSLGLGRIAANMFPAKYSFDTGAPPDCTNDYVVFGLNHVGAANQANLVAFNNLYSGAGPGLCGAGGPSVMFAYNISTVVAGRILASPTLSRDGTQIAFVETGSNTAIFHVVKWATGAGNGTSPTKSAVPGVGNTATMTSLTFAAALDTRSAPWVDYITDTAYVGADNGNIYKITGVFNGTPALAGAPWPVAISPSVRASTPVLDSVLGLVMVGSQNGVFHSIDATTGAVKSLVVGASGGTNPGILAAPIVDVTNGTSFVVSANDGTSGVLVEVDTATMTQLAKAQLGLASKNPAHTSVSLFQPAFSDDYFNDPSTGVARLCGTGAADITPWQYAFGFTGTVMDTTPVFSEQLLTSTSARCTGWTEFFNPFVNEGTDFFFFGLTVDCGGTGTFGCVVARTNDDLVPRVTAAILGGPSGIVVDNFSTAVQASSIYFSGVLPANSTAYKFTQNGLQ